MVMLVGPMPEYYDDSYKEYDEENDEGFEEPEDENVIKCANCGVVIENPEEAIKEEKYGEVFYFCSEECRDEFMQ